MDIQLAGTDFGAVVCLHGHFFVKLGAVVSDQNDRLATGHIFRLTGDFAAVRANDRYLITHDKAFGLHIHCHVTVQRKNCHSAMLHHGIGHLGVFLGIEDLDSAGDTCLDGRTDLIAFRVRDLVIQIFDGSLQIRHGGTHAAHIHGSQQLAGFHCVAIADQDLRQLHAGGEGHRFRIHVLQRAGAGNHGADGARGHLISKNVQVPGREFLPHLTLQDRHARNQYNGQNQHDADDCPNDLSSFLLFGLSQSLKKSVVLLLHGRHLILLLFFLIHNNSFALT